MKKYPAICIIETSGIAIGLKCTDAMLKNSPVTILKSGSAHPGKFLTLVGGSVASVEEAYYHGMQIAKNEILDQVFLPDIHESVLNAILGKRNSCSPEAIGIFETKTLCSTVQAADMAVKGMNINIVELRYSDDLGGKAFVIYTGLLEEVDAALEKSLHSMTNVSTFCKHTLIPRPDENLCKHMDGGSIFASNQILPLMNGEL